MAKHQGMRSCEVGKTVASGMRDLQFESHHQMLHLPTSALHCSEKSPKMASAFQEQNILVNKANIA